MTYFATVLIAVWSAGLLLLAGRSLNFTRLVYNNVAPGKNYLSYENFLRHYFFSFRFLTDARAIEPTNLTEVGRNYRKAAIRNDWITLAWALGGFPLLAWAVPYFMAK